MEKEIILPPQLFGSTSYYATAAISAESAVDYSMRADKRFKSAHRYKIVDTRGELFLTVPVSHLSGNRSWNEVELSDHGQWWKLHVTALESAYGRTPFFEFYIDRFLPLFRDPLENEFNTVGKLCRRADELIRRILELPPAQEYHEERDAVDLRNSSFTTEIAPYWQLRADRLGFRSGLSILDLIFNIGPESALAIRNINH